MLCVARPSPTTIIHLPWPCYYSSARCCSCARRATDGGLRAAALTWCVILLLTSVKPTKCVEMTNPCYWNSVVDVYLTVIGGWPAMTVTGPAYSSCACCAARLCNIYQAYMTHCGVCVVVLNVWLVSPELGIAAPGIPHYWQYHWRKPYDDRLAHTPAPPYDHQTVNDLPVQYLPQRAPRLPLPITLVKCQPFRLVIIIDWPEYLFAVRFGGWWWREPSHTTFHYDLTSPTQWRYVTVIQFNLLLQIQYQTGLFSAIW